MLGFLKRKSQNARIIMCIKQSQFLLDSYCEKRRAKILLALTISKLEFDMAEADIFNLFLHPSLCSKDIHISSFETLEDIRNKLTLQLEHTAKMAKNIFGEFPSFVKEQVEDSRLGLEILMSTLGGNIVSNQKDNILKIWGYLNVSETLLSEAFNEINQISARSAEFTGQEIDAFQGWNEESVLMNAKLIVSLMREEYKDGLLCGNPCLAQQPFDTSSPPPCNFD